MEYVLTKQVGNCKDLQKKKNKWLGAAAICVNSDRQLLMVLQGKPRGKAMDGAIRR